MRVTKGSNLYYLLFLVLVSAYAGGLSSDVGASSMYDWCYNRCSPEAQCDRPCENDGGGEITCGEYYDGPADGWCDGNTCENICSLGTAPGTECYDQNVFTDCYGYGVYASCGDDYCAFNDGLENCGSCDDDCGVCPTITCGNSSCEYGESYRTCPADCTNDGQGLGCGDGICAPDDSETCSDCQDPEEFCDGINHICPVSNQCVANYCSYDDVSARQTCYPYPGSPNFDCAVGYKCQKAWNVLTNVWIYACFMDRE